MRTNKLKYLSFIIAVAFFYSSNLKAQELTFKVIKSAKDWETAKTDASKSGKNIFLDIYATWCGPCKKMEADVYSDKRVSAYYNANYINLKVDGESEFGTVLASRYYLSGYPSLFFVNADGDLMYGLVGYRNPDDFLAAGSLVLESGKRYLELNSSYKTSIFSDSLTHEYMNLLMKFGKKDELAVLAGAEIKSFTEADILNPENKGTVMAVVSVIDSFPVNIVLKNAIPLKTAWGQEDFSQYLSSAFDLTMKHAAESRDSALMEKLAVEWVPVYMMDNPERIPEIQLTTRKIFFSETKEWENYIRAVEKYYNDHEYGNIRFLYREAYYIIENQINSSVLLNKSLEWAEMIIAVKPEFENYFLAAIINTYRADNEASRAWMKKAESLAHSDDEKSSLEELRKYLDAQ